MTDPVTVFLCGDVMTGRGIDQVLPHPGDPALHEPYMKTAAGYVRLAEAVHGPISHPVDFSYIWGDALDEFERMRPDWRIINLETSITKSEDYWKGKGIHYRMNPLNVSCLGVAAIDCCSLANNHSLDWGYPGLIETLETLKKVRVQPAGAGRDLAGAAAPAVIEVKNMGRCLVFGFGLATSGIPPDWAAAMDRPGVNLLKDLSDTTVAWIAGKVKEVKQSLDVVIASIHWGSNWGYAVPEEQVKFAHGLIDQAGIDIIHGHSSHHVKAIEVYRGKLIFYGCGDFVNDYEGISGHESYRSDLGLMYFSTVDLTTGKLVRLQMTPTQVRKFRVQRASGEDAVWLRDTLNREGKKFGTGVELTPNGRLELLTQIML